MLIDGDMSGGTITDLLRPSKLFGRGLSRVYQPDTSISPEQLQANAVEIAQRRSLRIVPGFHQYSGPPVSEFVGALQGAIKRVPDDVVICDLGQCLNYPGLSDPKGEAEEISLAFQRVFVVIRDDPVLAPRAIEVLTAAQLPQAELVIVQSRGNSLTEQIHQALKEKIGDLPIVAVWPWDEKKAQQMSHSGIPFSLGGQLGRLNL